MLYGKVLIIDNSFKNRIYKMILLYKISYFQEPATSNKIKIKVGLFVSKRVRKPD